MQVKVSANHINTRVIRTHYMMNNFHVAGRKPNCVQSFKLLSKHSSTYNGCCGIQHDNG